MTASEYRNELGQPIGSPMADWGTSRPPPETPMTGRHCRVERLVIDSHAEHLYDAFCGDEDGGNWTYLPYGPFHSRDEFIQWLSTDCVHDDPLFHVIIELTSNRPVGIASYLRIEPSIGVIEVGHLHFSPRLQRTPAATEAMFLMMSRVFDELGYRRYEWKCDALNERSRNAAMRLGFSFEGVFRQATIYKHRNRDTAWFSIIDQEWPTLKEAYLEWLSPENFSADGSQQHRLSTLLQRLQGKQ